MKRYIQHNKLFARLWGEEWPVETLIDISGGTSLRENRSTLQNDTCLGLLSVHGNVQPPWTTKRISYKTRILEVF